MSKDAQIWLVILGMGLGTYAIRLSFLGLIGNRQLPDWQMRLLRYVPVAVMPGLVAPLVAWPAATGGEPDPARLLAAVAALVAGAFGGGVLGATAIGLLTLYTALFLAGMGPGG